MLKGVGVEQRDRAGTQVPRQVDVVVPCHNYGRYLAEALWSLAAQTLAPASVTVVDDGSTDETGEVLDGLADNYSLPLRVLRHRSAHGVAASMREGIAAGISPYVVVVDADDTCEPAFLEELVAALEGNPAAGFAYPRLRLTGAESGLLVSPPYDLGRLLFEGNYIPMVSMMRRGAYAQTGGFRQLPTHVDWDLWLSFADAGWPGVRVDRVLYNWRRHEGAMTLQSSSTRLRTRRAVLDGHRALVRRHAAAAVPWTVVAVWKRLRARLPRARVTASPSGWVEVER